MKLGCTIAVLWAISAFGVAGAQVSTRAAGEATGSTPQPLKNAPFSAEVVTQYDGALDNGGRIHRETHGRIFRDSQGRMRTESEVSGAQPAAEKHEHITINDPVQQLIINLNPRSRTATIYHFGEGVGPTALGSVAAKAQAPHSGDKSAAASRSTIQIGATPPSPIGSGAINNVPQAQKPGKVTTRQMGANIQTSPIDTKTVSLGTRIIEGVMAVGTRTTRTLDADLMGTDKPVVTVNETWFSPEMGTTVLTVSDDGQSGHSTMKLVNIVRTEPDSQLFRIPSDYAVKESVPAAASNR